MGNQFTEAAKLLSEANINAGTSVYEHIAHLIGVRRDDTYDACHSIDEAAGLVRMLLPGRTIEIIMYPDFTGCRISVPGKESCFHAAAHKLSARAVVMALLSSLGGEHG